MRPISGTHFWCLQRISVWNKIAYSFWDCFEDNPLKSGWVNRLLGWILQEHRGCECGAHPPCWQEEFAVTRPCFWCVPGWAARAALWRATTTCSSSCWLEIATWAKERSWTACRTAQQSPRTPTAAVSHWSQLTRSWWINSSLVVIILAGRGSSLQWGCYVYYPTKGKLKNIPHTDKLKVLRCD